MEEVEEMVLIAIMTVIISILTLSIYASYLSLMFMLDWLFFLALPVSLTYDALESTGGGGGGGGGARGMNGGLLATRIVRFDSESPGAGPGTLPFLSYLGGNGGNGGGGGTGFDGAGNGGRGAAGRRGVQGDHVDIYGLCTVMLFPLLSFSENVHFVICPMQP